MPRRMQRQGDEALGTAIAVERMCKLFPVRVHRPPVVGGRKAAVIAMPSGQRAREGASVSVRGEGGKGSLQCFRSTGHRLLLLLLLR